MILTRMAHLFRCGLTVISPKLNTCVSYRVKFKKPLDLKNLRTFNEKILWLKLNRYQGNEFIKQCADKLLVRKYVKDAGCGEILPQLLGVYDDPTDIAWDELPNSFALKWNFGCGGNIICQDKISLDRQQAIRQLKKMKHVNAYLPYSEVQYKNVKKKLIVEEYINDGHGKLPLDYKVYCFNGKAHSVAVVLGRETGHSTLYYFDREWNFLRINYAGMRAPKGFTIPKPEGIEKVFEYAEKLSKPFPFVRADFYLVNGQVYFGELTFTPCGGMDQGMPASLDRLFGDMINLQKSEIKAIGEKCNA